MRKQERIEVLRSLGDEAAAHFRKHLPLAPEKFQQTIILTHVPLWPEAWWYAGKPTGADYLPFFTCKAAGEAVFQIASQYPHRKIICLCGHTNASARAQILPNLKVLATSSDYHPPVIEQLPG